MRPSEGLMCVVCVACPSTMRREFVNTPSRISCDSFESSAAQLVPAVVADPRSGGIFP